MTDLSQLSDDDLYAEAQRLDVDGRSTMKRADLEKAVADAQAAAGVTGATDVVPAADVPPPDPPPDTALTDTPDAAPAPPDAPTDGRPPLGEIAEDQAANSYVRVIGGQEEN